MRIAISGTAGLGKTTVRNDFLANWPAYRTTEKTVKDIIREKNLPHSKEVNELTQQTVLDFLISEEKKGRTGDKIIYDRCSLDNLIYTLWGHEKGLISKEFVDRCIPLIRDSLRNIDIIFFIPITRVAPVSIENDNKDIREKDPVYIREIDVIFKAMCAEWNKPASPFFARDDKPAIIEIFGSPQQRIKIIEMYLDKDGDEIGDGKLIDPNEIESMAREFGIKPGSRIITPKGFKQ